MNGEIKMNFKTKRVTGIHNFPNIKKYQGF